MSCCERFIAEAEARKAPTDGAESYVEIQHCAVCGRGIKIEFERIDLLGRAQYVAVGEVDVK